jgi:hypothetical protein
MPCHYIPFVINCPIEVDDELFLNCGKFYTAKSDSNILASSALLGVGHHTAQLDKLRARSSAGPFEWSVVVFRFLRTTVKVDPTYHCVSNCVSSDLIYLTDDHIQLSGLCH